MTVRKNKGCVNHVRRQIRKLRAKESNSVGATRLERWSGHNGGSAWRSRVAESREREDDVHTDARAKADSSVLDHYAVTQLLVGCAIAALSSALALILAPFITLKCD